ncbi:MAG: tripartite tricarboxylate transporter substrate binding protein [Burkholderiales bacterium]
MTTTRRRALLQIAGTGAAWLAARPARAQAYPNRAIRLVAPYAAGGSADTLARAVAEHLRKELGQPVVVDNKPGGNTSIGAAAVATAAPDGYTLLVCTGSTVVTNPFLYPKLSYVPERDLAPVARVAVAPLVVEVTAALPAKDLAELIRLAKAKPGSLNYASTGMGSVIHLATLMLEAQAGLNMTHIPFNGSTPGITAVLGGDVQLFLDAVQSSLPHIKAGKLRALAVTTAERLKILPDVPTVAESGFPGFDVSAWYGVMAPAKTPPEIVTRLNEAIGRMLADKSFREFFEAQGLAIPAPAAPQAFGDFIRRERDKWGPLIRAKNIVLE